MDCGLPSLSLHNASKAEIFHVDTTAAASCARQLAAGSLINGLDYIMPYSLITKISTNGTEFRSIKELI